MAIPSILANITIPLVGLVDMAIVGHLADATAIGGIAIGTLLFDLLYWNFGFLRVSTSGLTAQSFGQGDHNECGGLLKRSLRIAFLASLIILAIQWLFVTLVLWIVPCSLEVATFAKQYFFIRVWAAPATLALFVYKGWFIGMQDTISPMITDIVVNVVNMVASYLLAVYTPLGALGVAYGTVIAQWIGLAMAVAILLIKYRQYCRRTIHVSTASIWSLNGNLVVRSLCMQVVYVGFTALAGLYGDIELAVSAIIMKLMMLFSFFVDGFAYAGEALVGKSIGEGSYTKRLVQLLFNWSMAVGVGFTILYAIWGDECLGLLTDDVLVREGATPYYIWLILMPIVSTLAFMWDGLYIGATAGKEIRNSMIWAAVSFVAVYMAFAWKMGIQALYMAYFAHLLARVVYLTLRWNRIEGGFLN